MLTLEPWLLFLHILGAIIWIGGGVMLSLIAARTRRSEDPRSIAEFAKTLSYVGLRVLAPAVITVLLTGILMVLVSAGWEFTQLWILLALGIFVIAFLLGAVYLSRVALELQRLTASTDVNLQAARGPGSMDRWLSNCPVPSPVRGVGHGVQARSVMCNSRFCWGRKPCRRSILQASLITTYRKFLSGKGHLVILKEVKSWI